MPEQRDPHSMTGWGFFPFGKPNQVLPARTVPQSDAMVIGVYPGAWHVEWRAPPALVAEGRSGWVRAMAVDVEPALFWDKSKDDFAGRLARWKESVGFIEGKHGTIAPSAPGKNGSNYSRLVQHYLKPLGVETERTTFTAVYPVFGIKRSKGEREPADPIDVEYNSIAAQMGLLPASLPTRAPSHRLPTLAAAQFGARLVAELSAAAPALVVTLGEHVWRTLQAIPALRAQPPRPQFNDLYGGAYGARGKLTIDGARVEWLPLVHPGVLKGEIDLRRELAGAPRSPEGWAALHGRWAKELPQKRAAKLKSLAGQQRAPRPLPPPVAPVGSDYSLTILRARVIELPKRGPGLELVFEVDAGPHKGAVARGQFPSSGPGLAALILAALGEPPASCDEALASRLVGARVIADAIHGGTTGHSLALVRNVRAAGHAK